MVMQNPKSKLSPGCLVALIVAGVIGALALVHIAIAAYFLFAKFEVREVTFSDPDVEAGPAEPEPVPESKTAP